MIFRENNPHKLLSDYFYILTSRYIYINFQFLGLLSGSLEHKMIRKMPNYILDENFH